MREQIHTVPRWCGGPAWYGCIYIEDEEYTDQPGFCGLLVAHTLLFMSFKHQHIEYPCALVTWFPEIGALPCPDVGMWMVKPDVDNEGSHILNIIHVDSILHGTPHPSSLDSFRAYYINKHADHHSHEIAF
ncbi:hypothetical protein GGX14DRAFT_535835 [Mycena pura]|uniref:Uncharacterized protein n=1 Tax=Mycena pura TaxID=153505 RepID=A0AAD6V6A3_9AGAR|nr:hypothetical protein GGX14DRAFT_535835 [Mycena pura]